MGRSAERLASAKEELNNSLKDLGALRAKVTCVSPMTVKTPQR